MQPGDEVILSYEEYSQLKQAFKEHPQLTTQNKFLKSANQELKRKLQISQQKLIVKNGQLCKEQFKTQYLMSLFDDINTAFGIKAEDIGKGMKFLRNMGDTYFSVLKLPGQVDEDEKLPEDFSKSDTYMEVDVELNAYKLLAEMCTTHWNEKLKLVEYLESSLKNFQNKDVKKVEQEAEKVQKELRSELGQSKESVQILQGEVKDLKTFTASLQKQKTDLQNQLNQMKFTSEFLLNKKNELELKNKELKEDLEQKSQSIKKLQSWINDLQQKINTVPQISNSTEIKIQQLNEDNNELKKKLMELNEKNLQLANSKIEEMKRVEVELNEKISNLKEQNIMMRHEVKTMNHELEEMRTFVQITTQKVDELKNLNEKLESDMAKLKKVAESKPTKEHVTDIKSKLFSLISEYVIYLNKQLSQMELTPAEKKTIIRSEVMQVEEQFGKQLRKLKF